MMMKLYNSNIQSNPRRIRIFLMEKAIELPTENIDIFKGEQFTTEFKRKSPNWDIPLLELSDGTTISQVDAICRYLDELYPASPLYGSSAKERAQITMWNHLAFINGTLAVADYARNSLAVFENRAVLGKGNYAQIPDLAKRSYIRVLQFMGELNNRLFEYQYIANNRYSVSDITAFVAVDLAIMMDIGLPEGLLNLKRWHTEMAERPSAYA